MKLTNAAINELISQHQPLVRSIATKVIATLPQRFDLEDLVGYGQVGLTQAAQAYDPSRGTRFATFAYYRIRGAIYDGCSEMGWHSRAIYRKFRAQQLADEALADQASVLQLSCKEAHQPEVAADYLTNAVGRLAVIHLALEAGEIASQAGIDAMEQQSADEEFSAREVVALLQEAVAELPESEKSLIEHVYFEGHSLTQEARRVGKSKSWASRTHDRALDHLCRSLRQMGVEEMST